jgi:hypothetical protein
VRLIGCIFTWEPYLDLHQVRCLGGVAHLHTGPKHYAFISCAPFRLGSCVHVEDTLYRSHNIKIQIPEYTRLR